MNIQITSFFFFFALAAALFTLLSCDTDRWAHSKKKFCSFLFLDISFLLTAQLSSFDQFSKQTDEQSNKYEKEKEKKNRKHEKLNKNQIQFYRSSFRQRVTRFYFSLCYRHQHCIYTLSSKFLNWNVWYKIENFLQTTDAYIIQNQLDSSTYA